MSILRSASHEAWTWAERCCSPLENKTSAEQFSVVWIDLLKKREDRFDEKEVKGSLQSKGVVQTNESRLRHTASFYLLFS